MSADGHTQPCFCSFFFFFAVTSIHSWLTHHCHCVAGQNGANVQDGVVGHVGQDVDDGDDGHGNSDGQGKVSDDTFEVHLEQIHNREAQVYCLSGPRKEQIHKGQTTSLDF